MKTVMMGAQSIMLGMNDVVVCGGMESMSNIPYYVPNARWGHKFGGGKLVDGLEKDGLRDAYAQTAMGNCADATAKKYGISRAQQDAFAIQSYERAAAATASGAYKAEIIPVNIPQRKGDDIIMTEDEEYKRVNFAKIPALRPAFSKDGTVTAANASTINDGASALILVSKAMLKKLKLKPVAQILSFADAAQEPQWFTTTPPLAAKKAIKLAGIRKTQIDYFEVNEAFAVVPMRAMDDLGVSHDKVNVNGGAIALGHPLGSTGCMLMGTLIDEMERQGKGTGIVSLCIGGGMGIATIIERV